MTRIVLRFPVVNRDSLSCVWIQTGNQSRPLECKWAAREGLEAETEHASRTGLLAYRFCA